MGVVGGQRLQFFKMKLRPKNHSFRHFHASKWFQLKEPATTIKQIKIPTKHPNLYKSIKSNNYQQWVETNNNWVKANNNWVKAISNWVETINNWLKTNNVWVDTVNITK